MDLLQQTGRGGHGFAITGNLAEDRQLDNCSPDDSTVRLGYVGTADKNYLSSMEICLVPEDPGETGAMYEAIHLRLNEELGQPRERVQSGDY